MMGGGVASVAVPAGGHARRAWVTPVLVLGLAFVWIAGLGTVPLFDVDEGAFAEASREMLTSGDWGHTTLNGADRFDKPIGVYWLQTMAMAWLGASEFAARLPSALCGWLWCLALAQFARPRLGERAGLAVAVLTAGALGPMLIGRAATADALLNLLITLAGLALWRHLEAGRRADLWQAAAWIGLGWLVKGPVALLVPAGALLVWVMAGRQWTVLARVVSDGRAWAAMLAIALPWYLYALMRHGQAFIDGFFVRHNLERFGGPMEGHGGSLLYYALALPLLLAPGTPLLLGLMFRRLGPGLRALWAQPLTRYLLGWLGFVLAFFSLSGTKLPHYALYGATPALLLAAMAVERRWAAAAVAVPALAMVALAPASPALAALLPAGTGGQALALPAAPSSGLAIGLAAGVLALALPWPRLPAWPRALAIVALSALAVLTQLLPWWGQALQAPVRELGLQMRHRSEPLVQWRVHQPSFAFYAGRQAPRRAPTAGEVALVRGDRLSPTERAELQLVAERGPWLLVVPR